MKNSTIGIVSGITLGLILGTGGSASAATLNVPAQFPTIQAAVNASQNGDEVVMAPGVYSGAGNTAITTGPRSITIRSVDPANAAIVAATIIDGLDAASGISISDNIAPHVTIKGLTIRNTAGAFGSAIRVALGATATVLDCVITGCANTAVIVTYTSSMTMERCTVTGNTSAPQNFGAGGLHVAFNAATVRHCRFENNTGGGISNHATLDLEDCVISGNSTTGIGGGIRSEGVLHVDRCVITGNSAGGYGGGVSYAQLGPTDSYIRDSMIVNNSAGGKGGGVNIDGRLDSTFLIEHSTIAGNSSDSEGGGLSCSAEQAVMRHSIVWGNAAETAGDNVHMGIVTNGLNQFPAQLEVEYSVLPDGPEDRSLASTALLVIGAGMVTGDPLFLSARQGDFHLMCGSPCIDAGDPAFVPTAGQTDVDGDARVVGQYVDIGADEFHRVGDLNNDGAVGVSDLLMCINTWGSCPAPPGACAADIAPPGGDGSVGVPDLLAIINGWGPCP